MEKIIYRLANDPRVRHISKGAAPRTEMRTKNFKLSVRCAADFPARIPKLENLYLEICTKKLAPRMQPEDLVQGRFEVTEGFENAFKEIAGSHGFNASEVMECP